MKEGNFGNGYKLKKRADTQVRPYEILMNTGWRPVLLDG